MSPAGGRPSPKKRARPLAELIIPCLGPIVAKQGFSGADIILSWAEIVGERLAGASQPLRIAWPRRPHPDAPGEPATLTAKVEGAFALELQHLSPVIVERINAFYGWRCVGRLVLKQGPVSRRESQPLPPRDLTRAEREHVGSTTQGIAAPGLRAALERLGEAVIRDRPQGDGRADSPARTS